MPLRIANAQAFWGDRPHAAKRLMQLQPDLDYLTLDYLSELSLSIMAIQQQKSHDLGYAQDFLDVIVSLIPIWQKNSNVKVVTNAGGLNPKNCAKACLKILEKENVQKRIAIVYGDDVLTILKKNPQDPNFNNLENGDTLNTISDRLMTANAYFGASGISEALKNGADIVITGRVADPSLTVGPCLAHYGWSIDDYEQIASATVAGHLIECGTQVTGGASTHWLSIKERSNIEFPFVEMHENGSFVITKPEKCGGSVNEQTVKEQLLYEIGDPDRYISPDVTASFLSIKLTQEANDRINISGVKGKPATSTYKVSATYQDGYKTEASLGVFGVDAKKKALDIAKIILNHVKEEGYTLERVLVECLGTGDIVPGIIKDEIPLIECILRIAAADPRMEALECFSKEVAPMVTAGPQGIVGYASGRPHIRPVFGYWPCLIEKTKANPNVEML